MFSIFQEEKIISAFMGGFLVLSILARLGLGLLYQRLIRETDNMAATEHKMLKQCKLKFTNCFELNNGVANIPVFVDKFLNRLSVGHLTFDTIYHLSGQLMLLSVVCSGIGVCKSIIQGRRLGEILPFYIVSFLGLYIYFSVAALVNISGKRKVLKVNLVDYLENHLAAQIHVTRQDIQMLYGEDAQKLYGAGERKLYSEDARKMYGEDTQKLYGAGGREAANKQDKGNRGRAAARTALMEAESGFTKEQEKELEKLLTEFLA